MLSRLISLVRGLLLASLSPKTWSMAIVRRYADANGAYVGELYLLGTFAGVLQYSMIGVSLDTLPFDMGGRDTDVFALDTRNDFLAPMPPMTVRVGAQDPRDNDAVREHVAALRRRGRIRLQVQNRFVEHVMEREK